MSTLTKQVRKALSRNVRKDDITPEIFDNAPTWLAALCTRVEELEHKNKNLEHNLSCMEEAASSWMKEYDRLKAKYEPMIVVTAKALSEEK